MERRQAYNEAILAAGDVRQRYGIQGCRIGLAQMRTIYKGEGIELIYWPHKLKKLRGVYINDEDGPTVMVAKHLPDDPKLFTLAHELKHHLIDSGACSTTDDTSEIREIAAEVFAAELLLPEQLFLNELNGRSLARGRSSLSEVQKAIIDLKRETRTTLSYNGLAKRAERLGFADSGYLVSTQWVKLERQIYGVPFYLKK